MNLVNSKLSTATKFDKNRQKQSMCIAEMHCGSRFHMHRASRRVMKMAHDRTLLSCHVPCAIRVRVRIGGLESGPTDHLRRWYRTGIEQHSKPIAKSTKRHSCCRPDFSSACTLALLRQDRGHQASILPQLLLTPDDNLGLPIRLGVTYVHCCNVKKQPLRRHNGTRCLCEAQPPRYSGSAKGLPSEALRGRHRN